MRGNWGVASLVLLVLAILALAWMPGTVEATGPPGESQQVTIDDNMNVTITVDATAAQAAATVGSQNEAQDAILVQGVDPQEVALMRPPEAPSWRLQGILIPATGIT